MALTAAASLLQTLAVQLDVPSVALSRPDAQAVQLPRTAQMIPFKLIFQGNYYLYFNDTDDEINKKQKCSIYKY